MRLLDRLRNRMAAMEAETHPHSSPSTSSPPLQWDEVTYLDPREERAAMRESYANAVRQAGSRPSVLIVAVSSSPDARSGRAARPMTDTSTRPFRCGKERGDSSQIDHRAEERRLPRRRRTAAAGAGEVLLRSRHLSLPCSS